MQSPGYQEALRQAQEMAAEQGLRQDYYSSSYSSTSGGSSRTYTNTGYGSAGYENSGETALPKHFRLFYSALAYLQILLQSMKQNSQK